MKTNWNADCADDADARGSNYPVLINYLKATNKEVGLLLNFCKKPDFKRAIFSNERKEISEIETSNPCVSA
ncbi:MAG: hypothetical protein Q8M95_01365 [Candidatus Methanoperedens sp.]|nr:hypothetical protein [Candidatus Methanoperedens sp.]